MKKKICFIGFIGAAGQLKRLNYFKKIIKIIVPNCRVGNVVNVTDRDICDIKKWIVH